MHGRRRRRRPAPASSCPSPSCTPATSTAAWPSGRAGAELGLQGARGAVAVAGDVVTVTVSADVDYLILPGSRTVSSTSSATARRGREPGRGRAVSRRVLGASAALVAMVVDRRRRARCCWCSLVGNPWPGRRGWSSGRRGGRRRRRARRAGLAGVGPVRRGGRGRGAAASSPSCARAAAGRAGSGAAGRRHRRASGAGLLAQRLVAAVLVLLPLGPRGRRPTPTTRRLAAGAGRSATVVARAGRASRRTGVGADVGGGRRRHRQRWRHPVRAGSHPPRRQRPVAGDLRAQPGPSPARRWPADEPEPDPRRVAPDAAGRPSPVRRAPARSPSRPPIRRRDAGIGRRGRRHRRQRCGTWPATGWRRPGSTTATSPSPTTCTGSSSTTTT